MPRRLLINEQPSFASVKASIGYSYQQISRVPLGTANRGPTTTRMNTARVIFGVHPQRPRGRTSDSNKNPLFL